MSDREWLETDGLGGFAMGTAAGPRTRRYHGLLVAATTPPTGRVMLVAGLDAVVETPAGRWMLSAQRYAPDVVGDEQHLERFEVAPWPTWTFRLPDGRSVVHELFMRRGAPRTFLSWRLLEPTGAPVRLTVRPFLAGRDFHALMHENAAFRFDPEVAGDVVRFRPYADGPAITFATNGRYAHQPCWYRRFVYQEERRRGLDCEEDLGAPGVWSFELGAGEAMVVLGGDDAAGTTDLAAARATERERRASLGGALERAADQHFVAGRTRRTIIAGYPWFGDWGRDTFVSLRGVLLATGRVAEAIDVLDAWSGSVSRGMLPNYFPDAGGEPAYNSVDASLWYVVAVSEALAAVGTSVDAGTRKRLVEAVAGILDGYARGTRFGIRADADGLLAAGEPGQQLTWMDARASGREVTPRIGKPVEVQALWLNALTLAATLDAGPVARWRELVARGRAAFEARYWNDARGCLFDVVDVEHAPGAVDGALRPNQIFAVGGLPVALLDGARARAVVDVVERALLTPAGPRSLAPGEPGYLGRYAGGPEARDSAYHQGTAWPWLLGPFVEAFVRVRGGTDEAKTEARERFVEPLRARLDGDGHVPEVADGDSPHAWGGCPFQAWSVGELLRLERVVLR
ncbi:MAG TPA: amylo-alpha-1,6-glucosidase [Polyangia bacterium]|nr:amylo-alpha-1,6-glucosidase [Polyangia bacterium]